MKILVTFSILTLLTFISCGQTNDPKRLLNNEETRKEIFSVILNDHNYMTEFIQAMHGNQHAMMMMNSENSNMMGNGEHMGMNSNTQMKENQEQMGMNDQNQMMDSSYMMNMMNNNPAMMQMMMGNMMDVVSTDSAMSHNMVNLMYNHSQMRQMMMQRINNSNMGDQVKK
jgi:hypothetical protein